jgi:hypothetical protein
MGDLSNFDYEERYGQLLVIIRNNHALVSRAGACEINDVCVKVSLKCHSTFSTICRHLLLRWDSAVNVLLLLDGLVRVVWWPGYGLSQRSLVPACLRWCPQMAVGPLSLYSGCLSGVYVNLVPRLRIGGAPNFFRAFFLTWSWIKHRDINANCIQVRHFMYFQNKICNYFSKRGIQNIVWIFWYFL